MKNQNTWGGARAGSGRRSKGCELVPRSFRLRTNDAERLRRWSRELGISQADVIHELIETYEAVWRGGDHE